MKADIVLLAIGFLHVPHNDIVNQFGLKLDKNGHDKTDNICMTSRPDIFFAGDAIMGASLVTRAIRSGRETAAQIDGYLKRK